MADFAYADLAYFGLASWSALVGGMKRDVVSDQGR